MKAIENTENTSTFIESRLKSALGITNSTTNWNEPKAENQKLVEERKILNHFYKKIFPIVNKTDERVSKLEEKLKSNIVEITEIEEKTKKDIKKYLDENKKEIEETKQSVLQVLAIFVALFTFVSIEFQLIAKIEKLSHLISLSLILSGILLLFLTSIHLVLKIDTTKKIKNIFDDKKFWILLAISTILLAFGIVLFFKYESDLKIESKNEDKTEDFSKQIPTVVEQNFFLLDNATNSSNLAK